jgi:hypothetical protein
MKLGTERIDYELIQDDMVQVATNDREEMQRYVMQYLEDGGLEVWEVKRTLITIATNGKKASEKC